MPRAWSAWRCTAGGRGVTSCERSKKGSTQLDVAASLYEALTGEREARGRVKQHAMRDRCLDVLADGRTGVIADDVHIIGVKGLQTLRWYHDQVVAIRDADDAGFPLWLVGVDVLSAVESCAELSSRLDDWTRFEHLKIEDVVHHVRGLHPRLAETDYKRIVELDARGRGNLREWTKIFRTLRLLWPDATGPLTADDVRNLLLFKRDMA